MDRFLKKSPGGAAATPPSQSSGPGNKRVLASSDSDEVPSSKKRTPSALSSGQPSQSRVQPALTHDAPAVPMAALGEQARQVSDLGFLRDKRDAQGRREGDPNFDPTTMLVKLAKGEKLTPAMEQYWNIKKDHADMVIFFKMGKFYELFEEDALLGHRELDLAFMGKEAPHCGFPEAALPKYAEKLVALGHKVGVVEQMETPAQLEERNKKRKEAGQRVDKAVRREICSVLTQGTAPPQGAQATYVLFVCEDLPSKTLGVCFVDVATGCVSLGQCPEEDGCQKLRTLVAQLQPAEAILDGESTSREARALLQQAVASTAVLGDGRYGGAVFARKALDEGGYFGGGAAGGAGGGAAGEWPAALQAAAALSPPVAFGAFGGCLRYLQRTLLDRQLLPRAEFAQWFPTDGEGGGGAATLVVDGKTLQNLEVFANSTDGGTKGTLFAAIDRTCTPFGKRELRRWVCAPPQRVEDVVERQDAVAALLAAPDAAETLRKALHKLPDLERLLARVHSFSVDQASNAATHYTDVSKARLLEFLKALAGLAALDAAVEAVQPHVPGLSGSSPRLGGLLSREADAGFPPVDATLAPFREAFDWEAARKAGRVVPKERANDEYDAARRRLLEVDAGLQQELSRWRRELRDSSIELWTPSVANGQTTEPFQLAVAEKTLQKQGTPEEFAQQMSSKKGTKRFWTAELRELAGEHLEAKAAEEAALAAAAKQLFARFSAQYAIWRNAVSCAAELDCLLSLARASSAAGMCRPAFVAEAEPFLHIQQGVNLCVQSALSDGQCIPNDIRMGPAPDGAGGGGEGDAARFLLVTGPNMGGKSTVLRQACLTVLMAHLGCWVAAEACSLSPVDRIFTRVGANDAIMAGLSTFRVELEETSLILKHATARSLVILDELGRGTATFDGMAIAHGTLRHLALETRCRCLFATHYHALSREFERANPHVALFHMACAVDEGSRAVTFLYRFQPGACNRSHGIHVAKLAGLAPPVLEEAAAASQALEDEVEERRLLESLRQVLRARGDAA